MLNNRHWSSVELVFQMCED